MNKNKNSKECRTYNPPKNAKPPADYLALIRWLEQGVKPWEHSGIAYNVTTGHVYQGVNAFMMMPGGYCTFTQAKNVLGGRVKKGAKASGVVRFFSKTTTKKSDDLLGSQDDEDAEENQHIFMKSYAVFRIEDVEEYDLEKVKEPDFSKDTRPKKGTYTMDDIKKAVGDVVPSCSMKYLAYLLALAGLNYSTQGLDPYTSQQWAELLKENPAEFEHMKRAAKSVYNKVVAVHVGAVKVEPVVYALPAPAPEEELKANEEDDETPTMNPFTREMYADHMGGVVLNFLEETWTMNA